MPPARMAPGHLRGGGSRGRSLRDSIFQGLALLAIILASTVLLVLLVDVVVDAMPRLKPEFFNSFPSRRPERAGIKAALVGSIYLMLLTGLFAAPLGVGAAIYLEEYARVNRLTRILELNIANLAGVPSIVYGLLGLELFVRAMRLERSLLAGSLTMSLLILPTVIVASREALRAVPSSLRLAGFALGATRWQVITGNVLPLAMPGILTGMILGFSRAVGETAPLITIGALTYIAFLPESPMSPFTVLPIQAYDWVSRPQEAFHQNAAGAIITLLLLLVILNSVAIVLRMKMQQRANY